jgi:5,10-methylene-tetrahydrofolate dehydrogenase/methenyl tetrahydrofolate cyclohydrolase
MSATLIDGKAIAEDIRRGISAEVASILQERGPSTPRPGLAVIIVGTRPDSQTYVRLKQKAAEECGFISTVVEMIEASTTEDVVAKVQQLNADPMVHGMIVQLPLPKHVNEAHVLEQILPSKDVDGLHPTNVGLLHTKGKAPFFIPCTPLGVMELLKRSNVPIEGKRAVVIGRSNIVGLPVAQLLLSANATVTVCHSKTVDIAAVVREADIVVAACGQRELVRGSWIRPGAAVIDVGTNSVPDATKKVGYRLVGDVHFDEAKAVASCITPVPGGVGPMTIAMLLSNTMLGYKRNLGLL